MHVMYFTPELLSIGRTVLRLDEPLRIVLPVLVCRQAGICADSVQEQAAGFIRFHRIDVARAARREHHTEVRPQMFDPRKPSEVYRLFNYLENPVLASL